METFQRARSDEQREARRTAILESAVAMLEETPVSGVTLNELSRRVGLAKSNVLRYFSSREEILLELLDQTWSAWVHELPSQLFDVPRSGPLSTRVETLATAIARSLQTHRMFCDLLSAQASVLEHNVSSIVAARYKRAALANVDAFADVVQAQIPEMRDRTEAFAQAATLAIGAVWAHSQPSSSMLAAYETDPDLAAARIDFVPALQGLLATLIAGTIRRAQP